MRTVVTALLAALLAGVALLGHGCSTEVIELVPDGGRRDGSSEISDITTPPPTDLIN